MLADLFRGTWWSERAEAVSGVVEAVFAAEDQKESEKIEVSPKVESDGGTGKDWEPFWEPQAILTSLNRM